MNTPDAATVLAKIRSLPHSSIDFPGVEKLLGCICDASPKPAWYDFHLSKLDQDNDGFIPENYHINDPYHQNTLSATGNENPSSISAMLTQYSVMPPHIAAHCGIPIGSLISILDLHTGKITHTLYLDNGPNDKMGEVSTATMDAMGNTVFHGTDPIRVIDTDYNKDVRYLAFADTQLDIHSTNDQINAAGDARIAQLMETGV